MYGDGNSEGRWVTYAELAAARGIDRQSAAKRGPQASATVRPHGCRPKRGLSRCVRGGLSTSLSTRRWISFGVITDCLWMNDNGENLLPRVKVQPVASTDGQTARVPAVVSVSTSSWTMSQPCDAAGSALFPGSAHCRATNPSLITRF